MLLRVWLEREGWGSRERLARKAGVSRMTIRTGELREIRRIEIARKVSEATGGEVTVDELVPPAEPSGAKRVASNG